MFNENAEHVKFSSSVSVTPQFQESTRFKWWGSGEPASLW